jgi:hypothetical protein
MLLTEIATLDELLQAHAAQLGNDYTAYRNHTYRVVNLCAALSALAHQIGFSPIKISSSALDGIPRA